MAFTRAASAASSRKAKQELVRLLFGPKYYRRGPEAHRMLDHSIYTHADLKSAYLARIQELHPDKRRNETQFSSASDRDAEFISLQEAWSNYETFAKALTKVSNGSREADFTLFGVGCSFSDNDAERERRNEITDQACRGWFAAGQIGVGDHDSSFETGQRKDGDTTSLLDDDMFMLADEAEENEYTRGTHGKRKSLIDHMTLPKR